jgi:uncharacterized phage-associated protein
VSTTITNEATTNRKLRDAVVYVVNEFRQRQQVPLTRTKLVKFLYLADYRSSQERKKPVTGVQYKSYYYGPYAAEILEAAEDQPRYVLYERCARSDGASYYAYEPTGKKPRLATLDEKDRRYLDDVLEEYGSLSLKRLLRVVYQTPPFKKAEMLQPISLVEQ